jgi:uncharacterized protein (DUF2336 family)
LNAVATSDDLMTLARSRAPADRERLLLSVADLCSGPNGERAVKTPAVQSLLSSIFMTLVIEAERDIRKRLAEKLATAAWVPQSLANILALDEIEIARPIIAGSPVLDDQDLMRLLVEATVEHQIEVARRPKLSPAVVEAILRGGEPAVMSALASNAATELPADALSRLVEAARRIAALRAPLARHPQLTDALARRLYAWVGQSLREALVDRFKIDPTNLEKPLSEAVDEAFYMTPGGDAGAANWSADSEREAMEFKLVEKLNAAGQLRSGYLMQALKEERLSLFVAALTTLGDYEASDIQKAVDGERPDLLALACAGVRIDRSAFPDILDLVRKLNAGRPGGGAEGARRAIGAFGPFPPEIARAAFRQAIRSV